MTRWSALARHLWSDVYSQFYYVRWQACEVENIWTQYLQLAAETNWTQKSTDGYFSLNNQTGLIAYLKVNNYRLWHFRPLLLAYSVKRSDVTRWKLGYITPLSILHCISQIGENEGGQGHWVSQNNSVAYCRYRCDVLLVWHGCSVGNTDRLSSSSDIYLPHISSFGVGLGSLKTVMLQIHQNTWKYTLFRRNISLFAVPHWRDPQL